MPVPPNHVVQASAKAAMHAIAQTISARSTERTIADDARRILTGMGLPQTWYYGCHAFVLLGSRSCLSQSGREYRPADEPVGHHNLVTIDLSPCEGSIWGDYARSLCVEEGRVAADPVSPEFRDGLDVEAELHRRMVRFVTPQTTFHELHTFANEAISGFGYENLDFMGNVGHSIATRREDRLYIEQDNGRHLSEVSCFTFEPHIRRRGGRWGFKREDIYFFDNGECLLL